LNLRDVESNGNLYRAQFRPVLTGYLSLVYGVFPRSLPTVIAVNNVYDCCSMPGIFFVGVVTSVRVWSRAVQNKVLG
jgi:hypothetical protein